MVATSAKKNQRTITDSLQTYYVVQPCFYMACLSSIKRHATMLDEKNVANFAAPFRNIPHESSNSVFNAHHRYELMPGTHAWDPCLRSISGTVPGDPSQHGNATFAGNATRRDHGRSSSTSEERSADHRFQSPGRGMKGGKILRNYP